MQSVRRPLFWAAVISIIPSVHAATSGTPVADDVREMPYELAFSHDAPTERQHLAVSSDGRHVAYGVTGSDRVERIVVLDTQTHARRVMDQQGRNCSQPSFSPNGTRLAFYCKERNSSSLWIYNLGSENTRQLILPRHSVSEPHEIVWSLDGRKVVVPLTSIATGDASGNSTEGPISPSATLVDVYRSGAERSASASKDEDWASPIARARRVSSVEHEWLAALDVEEPPADPELIRVAPRGVVGTVWHPSRDRSFWAQDGKLWAADLVAKASAQPVAPGLGNVTTVLGITADGGMLLVSTHRGRRAGDLSAVASSLIAVPLRGGKPRELALPTNHVLLKAVTRSRGVLWRRAGKDGKLTVTVLTRGLDDGQTAVIELDLRSGSQSTLWRGRAVVDLVAADRGHDDLFGVYEDMSTPPDIYRFSTDFVPQERLTEVEPRFAGWRFGNAEVFRVSIPRPDGAKTEVTSAILLPRGATKGDRFPTVAVIYPRTSYIEEASRFGGGQSASLPSSLLTTRGYAVLLTALDVFAENTPGHLTVDLPDALLPQIREAVDLGYVDAGRVALAGLSFGAFSTALVVSTTNTFRAGICIGGVYDLSYSATSAITFLPEANGPGTRPALASAYGMTGQPWMDMNRVLENSPFFRADRIRTPLLILHSQEDRTPVEDARKMFNALRLLGRTAQYAEYRGGGHGLPGYSPQAAMDAGRRVLAFLDAHVRSPAVRESQAPLRAAP